MADQQKGLGERVGNVAHNDLDAGNPLKVGGHANVALRAAVAENARVDLSCDLAGQLRVTNETSDPLSIQGNEAHDAVDTGNPSKIGGRARTNLPAAVSEDDRVDAIFTQTGGQLVSGVDATVPRNIAVNAQGQVEIDFSAQQLGALDIEGDISHDAIDSSSKPVKAGGHATAALRAAVAEDDRVDLSCDLAGQLRVTNETSDPLSVQGNVAHDAADSGNPVGIGLNAAEYNTDPPQISADGDRVRAIATPQGIQWALGGHPNITSREYMTTGAQTDDPIIDTIASGSQIIITEIEVLVSAAGSTTPQVRIGFGPTVVPAEPTTGNTADGIVISHPGIAAGSGVVRGNGSGVVAVGGDANELRITNAVPTGGKITVVVSYYISTL